MSRWFVYRSDSKLLFEPSLLSVNIQAQLRFLVIDALTIVKGQNQATSTVLWLGLRRHRRPLYRALISELPWLHLGS